MAVLQSFILEEGLQARAHKAPRLSTNTLLPLEAVQQGRHRSYPAAATLKVIYADVRYAARCKKQVMCGTP